MTFCYTDCTYEFLLEYKEYLATELHYEPTSINQRLSVLKAYMKYSYGCDTSLIQVHISVDAVPLSTVPKVQREILDEESIACLLSQPPATKRGLRDTLIMSLLFDAAIRLDELIQLCVGDIYRKDGYTYLLIHGKGNKERKVSIDQRTVSLLDVYIKEYHFRKNRTRKSFDLYGHQRWDAADVTQECSEAVKEICRHGSWRRQYHAISPPSSPAPQPCQQSVSEWSTYRNGFKIAGA